MSNNIRLYSELHSVRRFTSGIVNACCRGESMVVLLPLWLSEGDGWEIVGGAFAARNIAVCKSPIRFDLDPIAFLHLTIFGSVPSDLSQALDDLVEKSWPEDRRVVYIQSLSVRPDETKRWCAAVLDLARRLAQNDSPQPRSVILFSTLDREDPSPPASDLPFRVIWWFGVASALDFRIFCREVLVPDLELDVVTKRWLEALIPVLAADDYTQIGEIVGCVKSGASLEMHLNRYALQKHWNLRFLEESGADKLFRTPASISWVNVPDEPPPNLRLWASGALYATPEDGVRLHAAAVRILAGRYVDADTAKRNFWLDHLIWQAQNGLCYGPLNEARLIVNENIDRVEAGDWPWRVRPMRVEEEELRKCRLTCEIGHLRRLLQNHHLRNVEPSLLEPVTRLNEYRKSLAHYRPLSLSELREFARVLERLPEHLDRKDSSSSS